MAIKIWIAVALTFALSIAGAAVPFQQQTAAPQPAGRWYKGNTHTHTLNSDGDSTPDDVVRWYASTAISSSCCPITTF